MANWEVFGTEGTRILKETESIKKPLGRNCGIESIEHKTTRDMNMMATLK